MVFHKPGLSTSKGIMREFGIVRRGCRSEPKATKVVNLILESKHVVLPQSEAERGEHREVEETETSMTPMTPISKGPTLCMMTRIGETAHRAKYGHLGQRALNVFCLQGLAER